MLPSYVTPEYLAALNLPIGKGNGLPGGRSAVQEVRAWLDLDASSDDAPPCMSRVLRSFVIGLNDCSERTRLAIRSRLPGLIDTADGEELEHRRSLRVLDWYLREWLPAWFVLTESLAPHAKALRAMETITDNNAKAAGVVVNAAWTAAGDAAWTAARDAARDAAWTAARDAAGDAGKISLAPTVARLQDSALALLDELITMKAVKK